MIARNRHARPKGQPGRTWAPLNGVVTRTLPDLTPDAPVMDADDVQVLRDWFAYDLWVETRTVYGVSVGLERLAPSHARRLVRTLARRFRSMVLNTLFVIAAVGMTVFLLGPVAYELGV